VAAQDARESDGDPFLASAARYRGLYNDGEYLLSRVLAMLADCAQEAERLEQLSALMRRKYGAQWWCEAPREKRDPKTHPKP
jgi:hypothetical protein